MQTPGHCNDPCHIRLCCCVQGQGDRVSCLMTKQAKVVAMTFTHATRQSGELLYDSSAAQAQSLPACCKRPCCVQGQEEG